MKNKPKPTEGKGIDYSKDNVFDAIGKSDLKLKIKTNMRKEYIEELEKLKTKMEEAETFAKKLPIFEKQIIEHKYTGNEEYIKFGERYKDFYTDWGINRGLFSSNSNRNVTNYHKSYTEFLFCIYVNPVSLFDSYCDFELSDVAKKIPVFFYDKLNSTFYATDEQIAPLLEELNVWYLKAVKENDTLLKQKKLEEAKKKLKEAEEAIERLSINHPTHH